MGAGSSTDHYIQDATEQDLVYRVQQLLVRDDLAVTDDWQKKKKEFDDRLAQKKIVTKYAKSDYKLCLDNHYLEIYDKFKNYRPGVKFDIIWIGRDGRNESKKGDFILVYEDGEVVVSYSLKVYVKGYASIQVRSGTYNSLVLSIILKDLALPSVGMYRNPIPKEKWKDLTKGMKASIRKYKSKFDGGKSLAVRDIVLKYLGLDSAIDLLHDLDKIKEDSIARFRDNLHMRNYFNDGVAEAWKDQCEVAGNAGASLICDYLKNENVEIKDWLLKQIGFSGDEELLALSPNNHLLSTDSEQYKKAVERALSEESLVEYGVRGKGIGFTIKDDEGEIISINVPFTLNKNGAWWTKVKEFEGKKPYPGKKKDRGTMLSYGEWRPQKSQEMATSINTYVELKKAGLC